MAGESQIPDLVAALEHAALIARQLSPLTPAAQVTEARESLRVVQVRIESFLSAVEPSLSSAATPAEDEPMVDREESEVESLQRGVEQWGLQNKRRKRPASPSSTSPEPLDFSGRRLSFNRADYLRSLDLVFQFHG
ncbi:uncharacterized protein LOC116260682 [Nymphaea colorata]|nr:uncharacterized protein LOC116260682 [Nymphaea colorata]